MIENKASLGNFSYSPNLMDEIQARQLVESLSILRHPDNETEPNAEQLREIASAIARRAIHLTDRELSSLVNGSSLASFYNINLLIGNEDPRGPHLRFNIYPDFPGDIDYHTHRTTVSSFILSGQLDNSMIKAADIEVKDTGGYEAMKCIYQPGKSSLVATGKSFDLPNVMPQKNTVGDFYQIPTERFHRVATIRDTTTLCLFMADQDCPYQDSLIIKPRDKTGSPEQDMPIIESKDLDLIRRTLSRQTE